MQNTYTLRVEKMINEGIALGKLGQGIKVMVPYGVKDDILEVKIIKKKTDYWIGSIKEIKSPSPLRATPPCPYFGACGGCQWQMVDYKYQPVLKKELVVDSFRHIAGMSDIPILDTIPSLKSFHYRNKVQLPLKMTGPNRVIMGFYKRDTHFIIDIDECLLHIQKFNGIIENAKKYIAQRGLSIYDERKHTGAVRNFTIRGSERTGETLIVMVTTRDYLSRHTARDLMDMDSSIFGVVENVNPDYGNTIFGDMSSIRSGVSYYHEKIKNFTFVVSATSFFQINTDVAEEMVKTLEDTFKDIGEVGTIIDAYSGVGLFSISLARFAGKVLALEISPESSNAASKNVKINNKTNVEIITGDADEILSSLGRAEVLMLDPPRKGIGVGVLKYIEDQKPPYLFYFSCNPATLARDVQNIVEMGYDIEFIQPFDMFPQTYHVETLTYLKKKQTFLEKSKDSQ